MLKRSTSVSSHNGEQSPQNRGVIENLGRLFHKFFYRYGLMCASHPFEVMAICVLIVSFSLYPFVRLNEMGGNDAVTSQIDRKFSLFVPSNDEDFLTEESVYGLDSSAVQLGKDGNLKPAAENFEGETLRLKRVILSTSEEALYGPGTGILTKEIMSNLFAIHEAIENTAVAIGGKQYTIGDICFKNSNVKKNDSPAEHPCLFHTPLQYWDMDKSKMMKDQDLLGTLSKERVDTTEGIPVLQKSVLGNVQFGLDGTLQGATSVMITYFTHFDGVESLVNDENNQSVDMSDIIWEKLWDEISARSPWLLKKDSDNSLTKSESARIFYWEENTKSSDILALLTSDYVTILYVYFMFKKFNRIGSKYLLCTTAVLCMISGFVIAGALFHVASIRVTFIVSEAMPFLFIVFGLEHAFTFAKNVFRAGENNPGKKPTRHDIAKCLSLICGGTTYDVFMKTSVLVLIGVYGTAGISQICLYGGTALVCGYILFLTMFPAVLAVRYAYASGTYIDKSKSSFEQFAQVFNDYDQAESSDIPSPLIERVKIISVIAALLSYSINSYSSSFSAHHPSDLDDLFNIPQLKSKRLLLSAPVKMLLSNAEKATEVSDAIVGFWKYICPIFGEKVCLVVEEFLINRLSGISMEVMLHPLIFCLIFVLAVKYVMYEKTYSEEERTAFVSRNSSFVNLASRSHSGSLDNLSSIKLLATEHEVKEEGAKFEVGHKKSDSVSSFEDSGLETSCPSTPRTVEQCLAILEAEEQGPDCLSDNEILNLLVAKKIPAYNLEKKLQNYERGVALRRLFMLNQSHASDALEKLPYKNYDYSKVIGQCCENVIGYVPIPVGYVGPVLLNDKEVTIPMATTEGCLLASCHRGCKAITMSGGATAVLTNDGMTRGPCLAFGDITKATGFKTWLSIDENFALVKAEFESTSRFAKLLDIKIAIAGRNVYCRFRTFTGDAMGMNMISKATEKALAYLQERFEFDIVSLSGNYCTDKKPAAINWIEGRGKSVIAEAVIKADVVKKVLKTTVDALVELNIKKNLIGSAMAGSVGGFNAHAANLVTAVYLACGQDPAQNVESSNCMTLMENLNGDLLISCTMPSIEVGTVGGGTSLPAQSACLELLGVKGPNRETPGENARNLAKIVCCSVLAGELSLMAALAAGHLVKSHMQHNRHGGTATATPVAPTAEMKAFECAKSKS
eukprot:Nk52_evm79s1073 gene=Nk52_evmTU79s1073